VHLLDCPAARARSWTRPERTEQPDSAIPAVGGAAAAAAAGANVRSTPADAPAVAPAQSWMQRSSWYRRVTARLGLQGKLIICFMLLLLIAMSGSYYLFLRETRATLWHALCERIVNISQSLAMAATQPLDEGDVAQLTRMSREFVKNDDMVSVVYCDALGKAITGASQ
jgi:hypothetical protein